MSAYAYKRGNGYVVEVTETIEREAMWQATSAIRKQAVADGHDFWFGESIQVTLNHRDSHDGFLTFYFDGVIES